MSVSEGTDSDFEVSERFESDCRPVFSRVLRDSTPRFVGPSVRPSIGPSVTLYFFWVFAVFGLTAPAQMME